MRLSKLLLASTMFVGTLAATAQAALITVAPGSLTDCPTVGVATSCAIEFRFNANGSIDTLLDPTIPSTDRIEDTLFGIKNDTGAPISSILLDGSALPSFLFGFDGDGQSTIISTGPGASYFGLFDQTAVGAKDLANTFTVISATKGNVNFGGTGLIGGGGSGWFVMEDQISFTNPPTVNGTPEPATMALFGLGLFGFGLARRRQR